MAGAVKYERLVAEDLNLGYGTVDVTSPAGGTMTGTLIGMQTFTDIVNVKDAGAVGDGVVDDTDALQTALDSGFPVYIPTGTYLTSTLILNDGAMVFGAGYDSVLKLKAGALTSVLRNANFNSTGNSHLLIRDLRIDGNHAQNAGDLPQEDGGCITFHNVQGFRVEGCWLTNGRVYGLFVGWSQFAVENPPQGPSRQGLIVNNVVSDCGVGETAGEGGIIVTNAEYVTIANNLISHVYEVGIRIESQNIQLGDQQNYIIVSGNQVIDGGANMVTGITFVGRNLVNLGGLVVGHACENNLIQGGRDGIEISNTGDFRVAGNKIMEVARDGIRLLGGASEGVVSGNNIRRPGRYGITNGLLGDAPVTCVLSENNISGTVGHGIAFDRGNEMSILGNIIKNAGRDNIDAADGLYVGAATDGNTDGWIVNGNQILDTVGNMRHGIQLIGQGFSNWHIDGNLITTARQHGMTLTSFRKGIITNNIVRNVGRKQTDTYDGLFLSSSTGFNADDNVVTNNTLMDVLGNMRVGIQFAAGVASTNYNLVANNSVRGNQFSQGIYFTNGVGNNVQSGNRSDGVTPPIERQFGGLALATNRVIMVGPDSLGDIATVFFRDPNGSDRNFDPIPGIFEDGAMVLLMNTGGANSITFDSTGIATVVPNGSCGLFVYDAGVTSWRKATFI